MREVEQEDVAEITIEEGEEAKGVKPSIKPQWNAIIVINSAITVMNVLHGTRRLTMSNQMSMTKCC